MKTKRFLGILITLALLIGVFTITASAAVVEGTCGDNAKWKYDDTTNTLTIFGKGAMTDYSSSSSLPWYDYRNVVTTVVVERGITHIGNYSFSYFDNLTTATIADTVETIGEKVFYSCDNLTSVKLPDSVKIIGRSAFSDCDNLTEIKLPMSLKSIYSRTFEGCSNLTSFIIPNSVETIGDNAFDLVSWGEPIPSITVHYSGTNAEWNEIDIDSEGNAVLKSGWRHYCTETSWKAATCTTEGQEGGIYCSYCQKYVKEPNTLPINPDNHSFEKGICSRCGAYEEPELKDNYYQIENAGQLYWFANHINTVDRTANAVLINDIDLEGKPDGTGRKWTPIGSTGEASNNFRGVFDGNNHTITGLYVEGGRAGLGFFGEVRTGTVKNFTIYGDVVVNTQHDYVGGVIGSICGVNGETDLERNGAIIQNITSYVNLTAKAHGVGMIGGFVGYANHQSLIENCSWYGTFDAGIYRVDSGAGGFIGKIQENTSEVTIRNCAAYGTIKTNYAGDYNNTATIYMGGFLSFSNTNAQTTLENCLFAGKFERGENLTDQAFLGAFGTLRSVNSIKNCYYLGDDGLEAVHSNSDLKPGSDNVEITSVTMQQLASGEVAYKLGEAWGQDLTKENSLPVLGGDKVYLSSGIYHNEVKEFGILSNGTNGTKATATVAIPTAGTYTLIFADYEETRLNNVDLVTVTAENDNTVIIVPSEIDITLGKDDKIMLWQDMINLVPLCEAYIVK